MSSSSGFREPALTVAQQEVIDLLGARREQRPTFDQQLRNDLYDLLNASLAEIVDQLPDNQPLWVSKNSLSGVHGCEARYVAEHASSFEWSVPLARGTVAHKAIELSMNWRGELNPGDLVDEALARLEEGIDSLAVWLQQCSEVERAELRSEANDRVAKFLECFPPLQPRWVPVTESRVRIELCGARIVLSGKVDLSLGRAEGDVAGKVLIDLKTGGFAPSHLDDLRFYALLETLRVGTPPRLVASYYLDQGKVHPESVSVDLLHAAAERTIDGVRRLVDLLYGGAQPRYRPGPSCRWCSERPRCETGRSWLAAEADAFDLDDFGLDE
ncbi:MAG: PD-(D/E)XK nuclease family protein [Acidimicrobiales bacterium]|nr:PD-(D/E)XK nuclease family protein [Acidimicrobiales bacterium]